MDVDKKISAVVAAVMQHIHEEEAALMQAAMPPKPPAPAPAFSAWSLNGRQTQMQLRNLMQLRTFQKF